MNLPENEIYPPDQYYLSVTPQQDATEHTTFETSHMSKTFDEEDNPNSSRKLVCFSDKITADLRNFMQRQFSGTTFMPETDSSSWHYYTALPGLEKCGVGMSICNWPCSGIRKPEVGLGPLEDLFTFASCGRSDSCMYRAGETFANNECSSEEQKYTKENYHEQQPMGYQFLEFSPQFYPS